MHGFVDGKYKVKHVHTCLIEEKRSNNPWSDKVLSEPHSPASITFKPGEGQGKT